MKAKSGVWVWAAVAVLLAIQAIQVFLVVRQESLTFDEDDHIFAGYMMWKTGDYGLNPEHPPLVKLLATSTILGEKLTVPPLQGRFFKAEAYLDGRDFLAANDHDHHLLLRMRLAAGLLALGMTLTIFFATREWFGDAAGLIALALATFDPNLLAHSALVTTDMGLGFFMLLGIWTFYRWASHPTLPRLLLAGLAAGCEIGSKHSGILLAPMLIALAVAEVFRAPKAEWPRVTGRMLGGLTAIVAVAVLVLWSLYGFRYAARPAGLPPSVGLADYAAPLSAMNQNVVLWMAKWHILPESYLIGLVDVKLVAQGSPTFLLGKLYAHGVWWYFPTAIAIKTTLGLLLLGLLGVWAVLSGKLRQWREVLYIAVPAAIYLLVAMTSGLNIGARHILPLWALCAVLAGGGAMALIRANHRWAYAVGVLILFHIGSALADYPSYMAYANEAWGGPANVHNVLSDANADWGQQLVHISQWQQRHPGEECWLSYFVQPEVDPAMFGVTCHTLPSSDTGFFDYPTDVPLKVKGAVMISAGVLSACELPSNQVNAFRKFQLREPDEQIDHGVMVYRGEFEIPEIAALSLSQDSQAWRKADKKAEALEAAQKAVALMPDWLVSLTALADAQNATGDKASARVTYAKAIEAAKRLEPDAQSFYLPDLQASLAKL